MSESNSPYNPLDKQQLAESIVREFFKRKPEPLPPGRFEGAGIYALYYRGPFPLYSQASRSFRDFEANVLNEPTPIYVGKSDPPGSRKGAMLEEQDEAEESKEVLALKPKHRKLHERLCQHAKSIGETTNLRLEDFFCRHILVDEIWVPLGEARLLEWFRPVWNVLIEGFGSKVEGGGREKTARSVWDILHPGRKENLGIQVAPELESKIVTDLRSATNFAELRVAIKAHHLAKLDFRRRSKKPQ